jgi:hypothetical protein
MKLFTLFEKGKTKFDEKNDTGIEGRRWAVEVFLNSISFLLKIFQEIKYEEYNDWKLGNGYYNLEIIFDPRKWKIEKTKIVYDGFHNYLQFGPLCFNWFG